MKKRIKRTLSERIRRFFNRKSEKEVKAGMAKEEKNPEEEEREAASPVGDTSEEETSAKSAQQPANGAETDDFAQDVPTDAAEAEIPAEGEQTPETPVNYVAREEFDALKAELADLKALISNLPKNSQPVDAQAQQELDKLTALENKWNN